MNLRCRRDGAARTGADALLGDRNRRRQTGDVVEIGLGHLAEELAGIGRERLDVFSLAFGVDGVEGETALAGAGETGDDDELVAGYVEVDVVEVMGARAADGDELAFVSCHRGTRHHDRNAITS